jgi:hypothetical protein
MSQRENSDSEWLCVVSFVCAGKPYVTESSVKDQRYQLAVPQRDNTAKLELAEWFERTFAYLSRNEHTLGVYGNGLVATFSHKSDLALALLRLDSAPVRASARSV